MKKKLIIIAAIIVIFIATIILFISPLTKYLVEKYDVEYTGREIKMDLAYVNPFTGYIYFKNIKFYEQNSDSIFLSIKGLSIDVSILKLFSKTYEINLLTLDKPVGYLIEDKKRFNFSDIIEKFSPDKIQDSLKLPVHFNVLNLAIHDGEFHFSEPATPINYFIRKVNFESLGRNWDVDTMNGKLSFLPGTGTGDVRIDFTLNLKTLDYSVATVAHKLDMNLIEQYLKDLMSYGSLSANIDLDLKAKGNLTNTQTINVHGKMAYNDFHFGKNPGEDYASFEKMSVDIKELDPEKNIYFFDSVMLIHPYFKYEQYDYLDNIQHMFGKNGSKVTAVKEDPEKFNLIIEIANYTKELFKNFLRSDYKINSLSVEKGNIQYNDFSLNEKFSGAINPFRIKADSVDNTKSRVKVTLETGIKPFGNLSASVSMNPKDNKDFDLTYKLAKVPAAAFNPYLITYTSFPMDRGVVEMSGNWNVRNDIIQSTNHFLVIDPRVTKRIKKEDTRWIPMPLIMAFIRERGNVIDYNIPITGDLKNPKFHLHDVLMDLLKNIFVKPSTTAYRMEVKNVENEIEKSLSLNWSLRQSTLRSTQEKFVNKIADFLKSDPAANIEVRPFQYVEKEKEYILFFEAKKKYFLSLNNKTFTTDDDSLNIDKLSPKDSVFVKYLDRYTKDSMLFTVQEKCYRLVGASLVNRKYDELVKERERLFLEYFSKNKTDKQVKLLANENTIPFNGFSYFKIKYTGDIPESLMKAYEKLNDLNDETPRDKYQKFRNGKNKRTEQK